LRTLPLVFGGAIFLGFWQLAGAAGLFGSSLPALTDTAMTMVKRSQLLLDALRTTLGEAALGYVIGVAIGVGLAGTAATVPWLRAAVERLAATINAVPVIVLGPLLIAIMPASQAPIVIVAFMVFFPLVAATCTGLGAASRAHRDLFTSYGASGGRRFRHLLAPAAVPALLDGMRLAVPVALLGATLGEWFGSEFGIGPILVSSMQNFDIELLWAAALTVTLTSLLLYGALTAIVASALRRYGDV